MPASTYQRHLPLIYNDEWRVLTQFKRDCLWSLFGPDLIDYDSAQFPSKDWVNQSLPSSTTLLEAIKQQTIHSHCQSPRLGHQFEHCWQTGLKLLNIPYEANLPIRDETKQTLGELDLICQVQTPNWLHIELAIKFYLGIQNQAGESIWIGPNRRDRLVDKLHHLATKQLKLITQPTTQRHIDHSDFAFQSSDIKHSMAVMKGCLFLPADTQYGGHPQLPAGIRKTHWTGYWTPLSSAEHLLMEGAWWVLPKYRWLSPAVISDRDIEGEAPVATKSELLQYLNQYFRYLQAPLCLIRLEPVSCKQSAPTDHCFWNECERWFVVPDDWSDGLA